MHHGHDIGPLASSAGDASTRPLATARQWLLNSAATLEEASLEAEDYSLWHLSSSPEPLPTGGTSRILVGTHTAWDWMVFATWAWTSWVCARSPNGRKQPEQ